MGKKKKNNISTDWLAKQFDKLCAYVEPFESSTNKDLKRLIYDTGVGACMLRPDAVPIFKEIVERIVSSPSFKEYTTKNVVSGLVGKAINKVFHEGHAKSNAQELINTINSGVKKWEVVVPLEGIYFKDGRSLSFGKIIVEKFNRSRAKQHSNGSSQKIAMGVSDNPDENIISWGATNAIVTFNAYEGSVHEISAMLVEEALDILRVFLNTLRYSPDLIYFGIKGSKPAYVLDFSQRCVDNNQVRFSSSIREAKRPVELTSADLGRIRRDSRFKCISKILRKEIKDRSYFENKIAAASLWFGRSFRELDENMKFLSPAICVETLLSNGNSNLTEHLAICISRMGKGNKSQKTNLYNKARELYGKRSNIVHSGKGEVDAGDILFMRMIARMVLWFSIARWPAVRSEQDWRKELIALKNS